MIYYFETKWLRFATYWFFHITALATPLALTFGLGYRPTWAAMTAPWQLPNLRRRTRPIGPKGLVRMLLTRK